jgi:Phage integrase family
MPRASTFIRTRATPLLAEQFRLAAQLDGRTPSNALRHLISAYVATSPDNFRSRILAKAVERANENLAAQKRVPLPEGLTPHKLRHTFASILYALGVDPGVVMDEMGHTDPALALRLYRHSMRRGDGEKAKLQALVSGEPSVLAFAADTGTEDLHPQSGDEFPHQFEHGLQDTRISAKSPSPGRPDVVSSGSADTSTEVIPAAPLRPVEARTPGLQAVS